MHGRCILAELRASKLLTSISQVEAAGKVDSDALELPGAFLHGPEGFIADAFRLKRSIPFVTA